MAKFISPAAWNDNKISNVGSELLKGMSYA